MDVEEWKLIPNSKSYEVSNYGRVKKLKHKRWCIPNRSWSLYPERIKTPSNNNSKKYWRVEISYKNGFKRMEAIHRLVAYAFKLNPNVNKFNQVNHIDGDRNNNHWRNLQWCTGSMNMEHRIKQLKQKPWLKGQGCHFSRLTEDQVKQIPELLKTHNKRQIAKLFNVAPSTITEITSGRSWIHLRLFESKGRKMLKNKYWL